MHGISFFNNVENINHSGMLADLFLVSCLEVHQFYLVQLLIISTGREISNNNNNNCITRGWWQRTFPLECNINSSRKQNKIGSMYRIFSCSWICLTNRIIMVTHCQITCNAILHCRHSCLVGLFEIFSQSFPCPDKMINSHFYTTRLIYIPPE